MNPTDLDRIERELGVTLPATYRDRISAKFCIPGAIQREVAVIDDADELLAVNRECRRSGFPKHYVAIGFAENGGIAYGLDVSRDPQPVIAMGLDDHQAREVAMDLPTWIADLGKSAPKEPAARTTTKSGGRRWWTFGR